MTESDRKLLTEACGLCWHEVEYQGDSFCCHCGEHYTTVQNHTFLTADDWELVLEKVVVPNKRLFNLYVDHKFRSGEWNALVHNATSFEWFLTLSIKKRMELVVEFIKVNPNLFPEVMEYLASLVPKDEKSGTIASGKRMPWEEKK